MAEIGSAFLSIIPSAKGFNSKLEADVGGGLAGSGKKLGGVFGKAFLLGGSVLAAAGIGSFLKDSIGEAREAQKVGALTANVIKTTGGAAKISAAQVGDLASALSLKTGVDDEAIQSGSNLLLTFKGIKREGTGLNDVFGRATAAAVDLSASGFGDINGASKQLGKALNDPIKGVTALAKSGVTFTEQQKTQIKTLTESGNVLGAQKIVLKEVESQVGGAAAATSTYGEKAAVAFGNIKEQIGTALLPAVDGIAKAFLASVPTITRLIDGIGPAFGRVQAFLAPFVTQVQGLFGSGGGGGFLTGLQSIATTVQTTFIPVLQAAAATFIGTVLPAITSFVTYVASALVPVFQQIVGIVVNQVLPIYRSLATFFYATLIPAVFQIAAAVGQRLKPIFDQLVATFRGSVLPSLQQILAAFQRNLPTIQKVATAVVKVAGFFLKLAASILGTVLPVLIRLAGFILSKVVPVLIAIVSGAIKVVAAMIRFGAAVGNAAQAVASFATKVAKKVAEVITFFVQLPVKIRAALSGAGTLLLTIGGQIVDGLKRGIENAAGKVLSAVQGLVNKIPKKIRSIMGIASPSKVTTILGGYIGDGLAKGITSSEKKITKAIGKVLDKAKEKLTQRIDDFKSLASGVGDNLTGDLFGSFQTAGDFLSNLTTVKGNLGSAIADFNILKGFGLPGSFIAKLFANGGFPLIHSLAQDQGAAASAASLFSDIQTLSGQIGNTVATNSDIGGGYTLADLNATLVEINKNLQKVPEGTGKEINGAAAKADRHKKKRK